MQPIRLAQIGAGKWGKNILRTLRSLPGVEVKTYDERTLPRLKKLLKEDPIRLEGVVVATPGSTHAEVALPFIKAGLPVFIEKPLTTSWRDAQKLQKAAEQSGSSVMVGHVHLYNPAFLAAKKLTERAGKLQSIVFEGMNNGPVRSDMSVLWDWGPHGVSMALDVLGTSPERVQAWGTRDLVFVRLEFPGGVSVFMAVSWRAPEKRVKLTLTGDRSTVVFDDTADKKVAVYRNTKASFPAYRPNLALTAEMENFLEVILSRHRPATDIVQGAEVVRILEAAHRSLAKDGRAIQL